MLLDRLPPQNIDAEHCVLGVCLIDGLAVEKAAEILPNNEYFYREAHKIIYAAILDLSNRNEKADFITVADELRNRGQLDEIGGINYLIKLIESFPAIANVDHYANIVKKKAVSRNLIYAGHSITSLGFQEEEDISERVNKAEEIISAVCLDGVKKEEYVHISETLSARIERIGERNEGAIPTGFIDHDRKHCGGIRKKKLYYVGARPSQGKTAFALRMMTNMARNGLSCFFASLETDKETLINRILSQETRIDLDRIEAGILNAEEIDRLIESCNRLNDLPIYWTDELPLSPLEIKRRAKKIKRENGLDVIFIDYFQLMRGQREKNSSDASYYGEMSKSLKSMCKDLDVAIVCLSQLSREVEKRSEKRPILADLRETGQMEQDGDGVWFLYRPNSYAMLRLECETDFEIITAKNKNGATGISNVYFFPRCVFLANSETDGEEADRSRSRDRADLDLAGDDYG